MKRVWAKSLNLEFGYFSEEELLDRFTSVCEFVSRFTNIDPIPAVGICAKCEDVLKEWSRAFDDGYEFVAHRDIEKLPHVSIASSLGEIAIYPVPLRSFYNKKYYKNKTSITMSFNARNYNMSIRPTLRTELEGFVYNDLAIGAWKCLGADFMRGGRLITYVQNSLEGLFEQSMDVPFDRYLYPLSIVRGIGRDLGSQLKGLPIHYFERIGDDDYFLELWKDPISGREQEYKEVCSALGMRCLWDLKCD